MNVASLAVTLFFVLAPFGSLPLVLALLAGIDRKRQRMIIVRESLCAFAILALCYLLGAWFLNLLDIGASDLKICGGAVLGIISLRMIFPPKGASHEGELEAEPFIVPLAVPLMAGPSAMTTVIIMSAQSADAPIAGFGMMALAWLASAVLLVMGVTLGAYIPPRLLPAMERLMGLLLSVIAVHMLMGGLQTYFAAPR